MTVFQLLTDAVKKLSAAGVENAQSEARWLLESMDGFTREYILLNSQSLVSRGDAERYGELIEKRAGGTPLQYILGEWDFCGETFTVGEGVLIPREETQLLVEYACGFLAGKSGAVAVDLCAGSGCVGLTAAKLNPNVQFYLLEKYDAAFTYLEKNVRRFNLANVTAVCGDLFDGLEALSLSSPCLLLSNPPYIPGCEVARLQREVLREPRTALDGGEDGLDFYRAIASKWLSKMDPGSACAVECGENQAEQVAQIFSPFCSETGTLTDFNNIRRVVTARVKG